MNKATIITMLFFTMALIAIEPAMAGPGGKIASAAFESFWGKLILALLFFILFPVIAYVYLREWFSERRARKDLRFMAGYDARFDWLKIQERVKDCFYRVHSGWGQEDLSEVSDWMTDWYWQNRQLAHLDERRPDDRNHHQLRLRLRGNGRLGRQCSTGQHRARARDAAAPRHGPWGPGAAKPRP